MNVLFTPDEISRAGRIVKTAGTNAPVNVDAGIASLLGPGSYDRWLGPKSIIDPTPPPRPGFWSSLGRSTLGAMDQGLGGIGLAPVRSFVGLGPGPSGAVSTAKPTMKYLWSKVTGDQAGADHNLALMRQGLLAPVSQARRQSLPYRDALSSWATEQHPTATRRITQPIKTLTDWWRQDDPAPAYAPKTPAVAPWDKPKMPAMPKPSW